MNEAKFYKTLLAIAVFALVFAAGAFAVSAATKEKLPRDNVYYEINNDGGDYGNYIETYHVPVPNANGRVFCVVYSDKIGDGGGAGLSCDWQGFHRR